MKVYLDNAATTPIEPVVIEAMSNVMSNIYGNPSSIHSHGRMARSTIENARKRVAEHLRASQGEIFFTSSATESNNTALLGSVRDLGVQRIITSPTEHPCVLNSIKALETDRNILKEVVRIDQHGIIDFTHLEELLKQSDAKTLVSIMHGNNEIGTINDIAKIGSLAYDYGALYHCDSVQTIGKYDIDLSNLNISFLSGSGHKIYGPKGTGFIYINGNNIIQPLIFGGGQERNMRSGTESTYGIAGIAAALDFVIENREAHKAHITKLKERFKSNLAQSNIDTKYNGCPDNSLFNILSVNVPKSDKVEMLMMNLDIYGVSASAGSACSSGAESISHVQSAINLPDDRKSIRFSFSHHNTLEEIDYATSTLANVI